ncbi:MAG: glycosyltransferase, partial [Candidatus Sericytochromatia bacterium]
MSQLQVFLLLNDLPQDPPVFAAMLQALNQTARMALTVINNGQPFSPKRMFHQLGLTCRLLEYPLRFHPAQVLEAQLRQQGARSPRGADRPEHFLWLEAGLLWHPAHLSLWLQELENWTWIAPLLLPGNTLPQTRQIYQVQALSRPQTEPRLQSFTPDYFPPCLCFGRSGIRTLLEWLRPEGQLPLLMMGACDTSALAWHPAPAVDPGLSDFALGIDEALARWASILEGPEPARAQVLLESLQRALPDSPAVYARLAPLLEPAAAVALLETALRRQLFYPELLALMAQALIACHQPELAALYLRYLQQRFAGFELAESPWPSRRGAGLRLHPEALPRQLRLSVCVIVRDEAAELPYCLESLSGLEAELIVVDTGSADASAAVAAAAGAQVCHFAWADDFAAARNYALDQASGDWVLMLDADESLDPAGIPLLRRLLVDPPPGLPCFLLPLFESEQGRLRRIRYAPRLFPRHPLLRFTGPVLEQLVYQGPGEAMLAPLPGLPLLHRLAPWRAERKLRLLQTVEEPRRYLGLGECLADLGRPELALAAYTRVMELEPDPDILAPAVIGGLEALLQLQLPEQALTLALAQEKPCQDSPDYWYLRGLLPGQPEADSIAAFERCLSFRGRLHTPFPGTTVPERVDRLPLLQLARCYRVQMHHPAQEL